jgi:hypothetical protein
MWTIVLRLSLSMDDRLLPLWLVIDYLFVLCALSSILWCSCDAIYAIHIVVQVRFPNVSLSQFLDAHELLRGRRACL